ncbi:hypothetical protein PAB09_02940 [Corynebacterium sp. SCR221107]|uniref:hypothetical protein n=1 Tax=Corynebacterium sp. SCR221107 TaxID=3017361 RepID=UPI0022EC1D08|nr:hypothetical protein [Corynebacterium sp. SCR221107]WBT09304.1 hypothetical protein PAB09_02940 [Corynebacterium sp. SCR221107]
MADKGIVPVKLSLTEGDFYTLFAPKWREHGAEWQAFLGFGDDLYVFQTPAELLLFLESGDKHDLQSHPKWANFEAQPATRVVPDEFHYYDFVGTPALLAQKPDRRNVKEVAGNFQLARAIGEVCGNTDIQVLFSSHSILSNPARGFEHFSGPNGLSEWTAIGRVVVSNWDKTVEALDSCVTVKEVEGNTTDAQTRISNAEQEAKKAAEEEKTRKEEAAAKVDPYDTTVWAHAGIDPIKISIDGRTLYTLRTYLKAQPVFLGKYGEIYTFSSSKALVRWLIEHEDHDLAKVSTWSEVMDAANAGDLEITVHPDNVYSFNGLVRDINKGTEAVDTAQMARAYELLADAADWAQDDSLNSYFLEHPRMQDYISYMIGSTNTAGYTPTPPFTEHADSWHDLEEMLTKRFSRF